VFLQIGPVSLPNFPVAAETWRTRTVAGLGTMQNMLLTTEYAFASWVHFWTLNGAPTLQFARIPNADGSLVIPEEETIVSAISNYQGNSTDLYIMMGTSCLMHHRSTQHLLTSFTTPTAPGASSYPMVTFNALMIRSKSMPDYTKAKALVDWIYWSQTETSAAQIARSYDELFPALCSTCSCF
jgi:hypothetical protein